jgi:enediyne biosynthesis protein E4
MKVWVWKALAVLGGCVLLGLLPFLLSRVAREDPSQAGLAPSAAMRDPSMRGSVRNAVSPSEEAAALAHLSGPVPAGAADLFEDVTSQAGIEFVHQHCDERIANIIESNGSGGAVLDFDNDGLPDIYLVNAGPLEGVTHAPPGTVRQPNRLYRNQGNGAFKDVTANAGVAGAGYGTAAAAADYDNDGFTDLLVVTVGGCLFYHNRGNGTFEDLTQSVGITHSGTGISACWLDVDNDGRLDLFVANYLTYDPRFKAASDARGYPGPLSYKPEFNVLYHNLGNGHFEDVSEKSGIRVAGHRAMSACTLDANMDGHPDIYVANDGTPNLLLINDGKGHFTDHAAKQGVAYNALGEAAGSMTASVGDCNGDGLPDILVSRLGYGSLYMASPQGVFSDQMMASRLGAITAPFVGWGCNFLDFDNDMDLDVLIANGDAHHLAGLETLLIENDGTGRFQDALAKGGAVFARKIRGRGSAVLDYNSDGRPDILITALGDRPFLLRNRCATANHWIGIVLEGTRSNRDGFGAKVTVTVGGNRLFQEARCPTGFLMQGDRRLLFGLGQNATAKVIDIRWPSGQAQELKEVPSGQYLRVREPGERGPERP